MEVTTNVKGQLAVSKAELRALEKGFIPSRPLFDCRYDLIIDDKTKLNRVQVKFGNGTPSNSTGSIVVKLDYENRTNGHFTYNEAEVDALIVYLPIIDKLCYLPKETFLNKRKINIRFEKSKNNQVKGIIQADKYFW